ncbi:MAG: alpha/beta hydrolase [Polyangiaceae bacterium]
MSKLSLNDGAESFDVTVLEATDPSHLVLFAVGSGGNPERHLPLLTYLAEHGCTIVAPHFERLVSPHVVDRDLLVRARRLKLALDTVVRPGMAVAGVGHSIGATILLALAGGQVWMRPGYRLAIDPDVRLGRLVLFTPPTGFFQAPGALDAVCTPILAWTGANDSITPPAQAEFLTQAFGARTPVEVRVAEGAGHFSFMNSLPPGISDSLLNREAFLAALAVEVCHFIRS